MTEATPTKVLLNTDSQPTYVQVFRCQKSWDELLISSHDGIRQCDQCKQSVYQVVDIDGFERAVAQGRCVMVQGYQRGSAESTMVVGNPEMARHKKSQLLSWD